MFHRLPAALCWICLGIGLLGILCSIMPVLSTAEENLGLHLLYRLRGPEKPQADVVVVAIDRESAKAFNLPAVARKWPRMLHSRLLERLTAQGAAVVAFDLIFHEHQQASNDEAFASAIRRAGNVILTQPIDRQTLPLADRHGIPTTRVNIEKMVSAIPILADAVLGQAPFPLPRVPIKLNQYWRFSPGSGDVPTLPVVAMHVFALDAFSEFLGLLKKVDPSAASALPALEKGKPAVRHMIATIQPLYLLFENDPKLANRLIAELDHPASKPSSPQTVRLIRALVELYASGNSRYLNFYGPPRTIETISYHQLLDPAESGSGHTRKALPSLKGKAVFVGQTESGWLKSNDGFYTAFTDESGADISGVEVAATAFANLVEDKAVIPLKPMVYFAILIGWGVLGSTIGLHFSTSFSAAGLLLLNGVYVGAAYVQFKSGGVWYPLVIPVLVQTPAAFIAGLVWKYRKANRERRNIHEAFGHYLPDEVVDRLAADIKDLHTGGQVLYSICLFTDAESYTTLSEKMDPESLTQWMNAYYEAIFKPIKDNQGLVLQVVGDSVLAMWTAPQPRTGLKAAACRAAVGITESVRQFNAQAGRHPLPTRIGIHAGEVLLGNIGAMNHYEYRPVGDIVNTASRLEGLNKFLGTRMLTSADACDPDAGCSMRKMGRFVFKGKSQPVRVFEILPDNALSPELQAAVNRIFASGLQAFEHRDWDEADKFFNQVLQLDDTDGPAMFYLKQCLKFRQSPPGSKWDGTVYLDQK